MRIASRPGNAQMVLCRYSSKHMASRLLQRRHIRRCGVREEIDCQDGVWGGQGIGFGQTWQNVQASRVLGASYPNNSPRPITVALGCNGTPGWAYLYVDGVWVSGSAMGSMGVQATWSAIAVVPPGSSYSSSCGTSVQYWVELR